MELIKRCILIPLAILAQSSAALAHELWIEPEKYQVDAHAPIAAELRNGQGFKGISLAWFDRRIAAFDRVQNRDRAPIAGRAGDMPAVQLPDAGDGLLVLAYQSTPSELTYTEADKFTDFVRHKDLKGTMERHKARGLPEVGFREVYTRFSKALIAAGDGAGADQPLGWETEFVAQTNPYTAPLDQGIRVLLTYQGAPRADAQVEIFDRAPDGTVQISTTRTDGDGMATVPVTPGHSYLLDAVVMREPDAQTAKTHGAVWESLWAALTFSVPQ